MSVLFRKHLAVVTWALPREPGVARLKFECKECGTEDRIVTYIVSVDLLEHHSKRWKTDGTGETLARVAYRLSQDGKVLELITEADVTRAVEEQARFERQNPLDATRGGAE